jgi:CheY-like chemotaxis protein
VKLQNSEAVLKADPNKQEDVEPPPRQKKSEPKVQPNQKRTELTQIPKKVAPPNEDAKETYAEQEHGFESERRKRDVLDDLSYKLRQPAHQLLGIAEKLLVTPLTTEQRALVASIQSRAESLLCLNQALIERPRAAVAQPNPRWLTFDLYSAIEEATEKFADEARQRKIELAVLVDQQVPLELQGDQSCLCKVLTHLIRPTLKLAKTGPVLLHVTKEEEIQSSVTLRFVVRGFDLERGQKFQRYWLQAIASGEQPKVSKYEDGELDVAVAQQLVGVMKGRFGIEFSADLSSSFWFNVEFSKAAESTQSSLIGLRALVIDQDQMKRDLLQARLQASGLECSMSPMPLMRRPCSAARSLRVIFFKVALIGGQLGDMSGLTLAKFPKGDPTLAHIALVIMQAETAEFQEETCRNAGIIACITEPLRQSRLFTILREIAGQG